MAVVDINDVSTRAVIGAGLRCTLVYISLTVDARVAFEAIAGIAVQEISAVGAMLTRKRVTLVYIYMSRDQQGKLYMCIVVCSLYNI